MLTRHAHNMSIELQKLDSQSLPKRPWRRLFEDERVSKGEAASLYSRHRRRNNILLCILAVVLSLSTLLFIANEWQSTPNSVVTLPPSLAPSVLPPWLPPDPHPPTQHSLAVTDTAAIVIANTATDTTIAVATRPPASPPPPSLPPPPLAPPVPPPSYPLKPASLATAALTAATIAGLCDWLRSPREPQLLCRPRRARPRA